jgi:hypothetical protein
MAGILVLIVVCFGSVVGYDVRVQNGNLDVDVDLDVGGDLDVDDDAEIGGYIDVYSAVYSDYVDTGPVLASGDVYSYDDVEASDDLDAGGDVEADYVLGYTMGIFAKVSSSGGYDPPYVLYDPQTREQIIDRIKEEVP